MSAGAAAGTDEKPHSTRTLARDAHFSPRSLWRPRLAHFPPQDSLSFVRIRMKTMEVIAAPGEWRMRLVVQAASRRDLRVFSWCHNASEVREPLSPPPCLVVQAQTFLCSPFSHGLLTPGPQ